VAAVVACVPGAKARWLETAAGIDDHNTGANWAGGNIYGVSVERSAAALSASQKPARAR